MILANYKLMILSFSPRQQENRSGFALVLALSMMAFVVMLLMSMTLFVRVETLRSDITRTQIKAKENARLALMMAVGQLQKHVGPDPRVTARAEILDDNDFNMERRFWTGVWDTGQAEKGPYWLVSWQDQATAANTNSMQVVGPASTGSNPNQFVKVPVIEFRDEENRVRNLIGWWISDEGLKASIGRKPLHLRKGTNYQSPALQRMQQPMLACTHGLEEIYPNYNRFLSPAAQKLDRIHSHAQLYQLSDFQDPTTWNFSGESDFHASTTMSLGVLASVLPGSDAGLLQDLSLFPQLISSGFDEVIQQATRQTPIDAADLISIPSLKQSQSLNGLSSIENLSDGQIARPIIPILTNLMLAFTIRSESANASHPNFYLRMRFFGEFWNPYTTSLSMQSKSGESLNLELEITGLPTVFVEKTTGSAAVSSPINIQELLKDSENPNDALVIRLHYDQTEDWLPGRSKNWTGVDANSAVGASPYDSRNTNTKEWNANENTVGGKVGIDTGVARLSGNIRHFSEGTDLLAVKVYAHNPLTDERELLSELNGFKYESVSTRPSGYSNAHRGATFGYHLLLRGPEMSTADPDYYRGRWLHDHDPRNPKPLLHSDWQLDNEPTNSTGSAYAPVQDGMTPLLIPDPAAINETSNTINTVIFRRLWDRSKGSSAGADYYNQLWQDAPLFEILRDPPLSLASLQHLYFHNERPLKVGNSWGSLGAINTLAWFDRYYFSGLSRMHQPTDYSSDKGFPNPTLINYDLKKPETLLEKWQAADSDNAEAAKELAKHVLIANRFNINSTSVAAWKSVLSTLSLQNWNYLNYPDDTSDLSKISLRAESKQRFFTRYSQSLAETYDAPPAPPFEKDEPIPVSAFYRRGARHFDSAQIEALAQAIVTRLKKRGTPFMSMEAFLSPLEGSKQSLLEQAIAHVFAPTGRQQWDHDWETQSTRSEKTTAIDHFAPAFLTQADVMSAIGPMLAPRSDTFRIRARGETRSTISSSYAAATLEAIVQRTPERSHHSAEEGQSQHRRFKIISVRWVSEGEL